MTPRNPLDKKVIVDRKTVEALDKFARRLGFERGKAFVDLRKALAQDNTGWAAAPVEATADMFERICEAGGSDDWDGIWPGALIASPPLPGGGE